MHNRHFFLHILIIIGMTLFYATPIQAQTRGICEESGINVTFSKNTLIQNVDGRTLQITISGVLPTETYYLRFDGGFLQSSKLTGSSTLTFSHTFESILVPRATPVYVVTDDVFGPGDTVLCKSKNTLSILPYGEEKSCTINYTQKSNTTGKTYSNPACIETEIPITLSAQNIIFKGTPFTGNAIIRFPGQMVPFTKINNGSSPQITLDPPNTLGSQTIEVKLHSYNGDVACSTPVIIKLLGKCSEEEREAQVGPDLNKPFKLCEHIPDTVAQGKCLDCLGDNSNGIWTAVGCVRFGSKELVEDVLKLFTGIGGGIALVLMLFGAAQMSLSAGDPKAMQAGKDTFSSALIGLLVVIFSVVILNIIGVEIFKIPGF